MVRGLSSPTGRRPEPKQPSNVPCEDQEHDPSILHCRNQGRYGRRPQGPGGPARAYRYRLALRRPYCYR